MHPLEISTEHRHDGYNDQCRAKGQQREVTIRNTNQIRQFLGTHTHDDGKDRTHCSRDDQCRMKYSVGISILLQGNTFGNHFRDRRRQTSRGQDQQEGINIIPAGIDRIPLVPDHICQGQTVYKA